MTNTKSMNTTYVLYCIGFLAFTNILGYMVHKNVEEVPSWLFKYSFYKNS